MGIITKKSDFYIQACHIHGVFVVDKPTLDTYILEGFDIDMTPIKSKWHTVENYRPITVAKYRELVKWANHRRLEQK